MLLGGRFLRVRSLKAKSSLNLGLTAFPTTVNSKLVRTDWPLIKLDFAGSKSSLFLRHLRARRGGGYWLLILDGYGSHLTAKFDEIASKNIFIPICMLAHLSHLLQPLGIGCFAVLKRSYSRLVEMKMRNGINYIDKNWLPRSIPLRTNWSF